MSNEVFTVRPNGAADQAAAHIDAAPREVDLATWFSQGEVCMVLGWSPRTLNEKIAAGKGPEKRMRPMEGRKDAPFYNPEDVERIRAAQEPKPAIFPASSGVGPRRDSDDNGVTLARQDMIPAPASTELVAVVAQLAQAMRKPRGPWLDIKTAAARSGLSKAMVYRAALHCFAKHSPDVIRDGNRLKIRRAALDELDAQTLNSLAPYPGPIRKRKKKAADEAARPIAAAQSVVAL